MGGSQQMVLVTGYPGFIGRRLVTRLVEDVQATRTRLAMLVQPRHTARIEEDLRQLGASGHEVLEGDVARMHLGLSGAEYRRLVSSVTDVWHLAAVCDLGADRALFRRVNVEGTRNILELARSAPQMKRLNYFSTAWVSGDRVGVILEDELEADQGFHNAYEESKFQAEVLVRRAMGEVPTTVYRPGIVVGDSRTGEIDRFDGPYYLAILLVTSPLSVPLPLPGDGAAPLNVVPVDFVIEAALSISRNPEGLGKTIHVVDPAPLSARRVYEIIARRTNKKLPPVSIPHRAVEAILRLPVIERFFRPQRAAIQYVNHLAMYNCHNLLALLDGTGIQCPPLSRYLDRLIEFVKTQFEKRRQAETAADTDDPLDTPPSPSSS